MAPRDRNAFLCQNNEMSTTWLFVGGASVGSKKGAPSRKRRAVNCLIMAMNRGKIRMRIPPPSLSTDHRCFFYWRALFNIEMLLVGSVGIISETSQSAHQPNHPKTHSQTNLYPPTMYSHSPTMQGVCGDAYRLTLKCEWSGQPAHAPTDALSNPFTCPRPTPKYVYPSRRRTRFLRRRGSRY